VLRFSSRDACPWNVRIARALPEDSPYAPREVLAEKVAHDEPRPSLRS